MSLRTRKEILLYIRERYQKARWQDKRKILDEFIKTTGYARKHVISLLNKKPTAVLTEPDQKRIKKRKYDEEARQALLIVWNAANQICSKRLAPFIPDLLAVLERYGHLSVPDNIRCRLLKISPATIDRLLRKERLEGRKGISTTRPGSLLKKQIKIRTFTDWNDVIPGFLEGDLVAHCGDRIDGVFLNTFVLTDIASGWTEFFPMLKKGEADVIAALQVAQKILPFALLGLDTDNGSEFINYALLDFCKKHEITFTRSRAYKKNDQAHVEEKNGSIIRRLLGYDRYEGLNAYNALSELYSVLRLYINFFQPSLKLISKKREGAKVSKKYDVAKTPYQRLLCSSCTPEEAKARLKQQYDNLDPVVLLKELEVIQDSFWRHAWKPVEPGIIASKDNDTSNKAIEEITTAITAYSGALATNGDLPATSGKPQLSVRRYRRTNKPRNNCPRTWRTKVDPFNKVWDKIRIKLELNPAHTAKGLLEELIAEQAEQINMNQLRTLQRRVAAWRMQQVKMVQQKNSERTFTNVKDDEVSKYVSLIANAIVVSK